MQYFEGALLYGLFGWGGGGLRSTFGKKRLLGVEYGLVLGFELIFSRRRGGGAGSGGAVTSTFHGFGDLFNPTVNPINPKPLFFAW